MKYRIVRKAAAAIFAFLLAFTIFPALKGSMSVYAASPTVMATEGSMKGCIGGFCYAAQIYDTDSPNAPVRVDVYLDSNYVDTVTSQSGSIKGFAESDATGEHTVVFKVYDINSSGIQTGETSTYKTYTVNVRSADSFTDAEIDVVESNCAVIRGTVPNSAGTKMEICTSKDGKYESCGLPASVWRTRSFTVEDKQFLSGTVYAKVTVSDGNNTKTIIKEINVKDHVFDSEKVITPAKCFTTGKKLLTCSKCGDTETETIPAIGHHSWNSGTITKPAKYFTKGEKTFKCKTCGAKKTTVIAKLDITKVTPAKAKIKTASVKNNKLTLKWKRIAKNTKGYQIGIKDKKSHMTRYVTVKQKSKATLSKKIKLEKGRKYAVKVRAYNIVEGKKVYGSWSTAKSGKV